MALSEPPTAAVSIDATLRTAWDETRIAGRPFGLLVIEPEVAIDPAVEAMVAAALAGSGARFSESGRILVALDQATSRADLEAAAERTFDALRAQGAPHRTRFSVGLAHNVRREQLEPTLAFETLLEVAHEGANLASNSGGDRWCHTELYGLCKHPPAPLPVREAEPETEPEPIAVSTPAKPESREPLPKAQTSPSTPAPRVDLLERRLAKVLDALAEAESRIAELASAGIVEHGLPSIYRDVQGLDHTDTHFERKLNMMSAIFEANLGMRSA